MAGPKGLYTRAGGADLLTMESGFTVADRRAIVEDLAAADAVQEGLGLALARFVIAGEGEGVLLTVDALLAAGGDDARRLDKSLMLFPYRAYGWDAEETEEQLEARCERRRRILLRLEGFDVAGMRRLGLLHARASSHYGMGTALLPRWLNNLWHGGEMIGRGHDREREPVLTADRIRAMLALDGLGIEALVDFAFGGPHYRATLEDRLPDLPAVLAAEPDPVHGAMSALPAANRGVFADYLARTGLLGRLPACFELVFLAAGSKAKATREPALGALLRGDRAALERRALAALASASAAERMAGVNAVAELGGPDALARLDAHAAAETSKGIVQAIAALRPRLALGQDAAEATDGDGPGGYTAMDGSRVEPPPLRETPDTIPADTAAVLEALMAESAALSRGEYDDPSKLPEYLRKDRGRYRAPHDPQDIPSIVQVLGGEGVAEKPVGWFTSAFSGYVDQRFPATAVAYSKGIRALLARPDFGLRALARIVFAGDDSWGGEMGSLLMAAPTYGGPPILELGRRMRAGGDFRELIAQLEAMGIPTAASVPKFLDRLPWFEDDDEPAGPTMWPVLAAHFDLIDAGLVERSALRRSNGHAIVLRLCGLFPKPPRRFLAVLVDAAAQGDRADRRAARRLLGGAGDLTPIIVPVLKDAAASRRSAAAGWLGERRWPAAVPALRAALAAEKDLATRAAILTALALCGDDVSDQFSEARLAEEARRELPKLAEDYGEMPGPPPLRWADGRAVDPLVVRHWFARAHRLKRPGGDPLLALVLERLDRGDAAAMGRALLSSFAQIDARKADADGAAAYAEAEADRLVRARSWDKTFTREKAVAELRAAKLGDYLGSALDHRGLLALARFAPAGEAVAVARRYLKDHGVRANQCRALLDMLASDPVPQKLQLILAAAQRHKQPGARKHAGELAAAVAEERGWTAAELADRTVPTLDLDEDGTLPLPLGDRAYRLRLDDAADGLRFVLENEAGRPVSALPSPGDPAEAGAAKAAKAAVSAARKELKQTTELQAARLYGAMCVGRRWTPEDFGAFLAGHPILSRLLRRLVVSLHGPDGTVLGSARLLEDGTLTDAGDGAASLDGVGAVGIAHRATLGEAASAAWRTHLDDYGVAPLFPQFDRPPFALDDPKATEVVDRRGHAIGNLALRSAAAKLGYAPGAVEEASFAAYEKPFPDLGLAAAIGFSGGFVGDREQRVDALHGLRFVKTRAGGASRMGAEGLPLGRVPPVLLQEAWADYHAVAAAGTGFDPNWEKLGLW